MQKNETVLPVKGIRSPRILIWLRGFLHGKLHTGGLDPATNRISSGYISGQTKRFRNACVQRREKAEEKLSEKWVQADHLLIDFAAVSEEMHAKKEDVHIMNDDYTTARAKERAVKECEEVKARYQAVLKEIVSVANEIQAEYNAIYAQMEATSELLQSTFAAYGHGLLLRPIFASDLPEMISFEDCAEKLLSTHKDTWAAMQTILKEEVKK